MFKRKYNIITKEWGVITTLRLSETPRANEMLYVKVINKYYTVLNAIHEETPLHNTTYIVVEELNKPSSQD